MSDWRLQHVRDLDERDRAVAEEIERVTELAERVNGLRDRARELDDALAAIPKEREAVEEAARRADRDLAAARDELAAAQATVRDLERSRRRSREKLDAARRTLHDAENAAADADARSRRVADRRSTLETRLRQLETEATAVVSEAAAAAADLRRVPRLADGAAVAPDGSLRGVDEWGGGVRAALFIARGTLTVERERVVAEANALAASLLGEDPGPAGVAQLRRRVEEALG